MGEENVLSSINSTSDGGRSGTHPTLPAREFFVAPATENEKNLIVSGLLPIACWRVDDLRFDFDSSFVQPEAADEIKHLAQLIKDHSLKSTPAAGGTATEIPPPISIFGHADPVGHDDYNKQLAGRRATVIYALLTRKPDLWEKVHSNAHEQWGVEAFETMLATTDPALAADQSKLHSGAQKRQNNAGARKALYLAYMDALCGDLKLDPTDDFLAGSDPAGKGDFQGCGEFNPVMLFSNAEQKEFSKPENKEKRDSENAINRRVVALLFRPGSRVIPAKWPCPTVDEGVAGCKKRFWSNGEERRSALLPDARRNFDETHDTFGCRFYHRLTDDSPCEKVNSLIPIQLLYEDNSPMAEAEFEAVFDEETRIAGKTDANGKAVIVRPEGSPAVFTLFLNTFPEKYAESGAGVEEDGAHAFWPHGIMS